MNSVAWVYLPYFAFLGLVIAGLHYGNKWIIAFGVLAFFIYDVKEELKIICNRTIYNECEFYTVEKKEQGK